MTKSSTVRSSKNTAKVLRRFARCSGERKINSYVLCSAIYRSKSAGLGEARLNWSIRPKGTLSKIDQKSSGGMVQSRSAISRMCFGCRTLTDASHLESPRGGLDGLISCDLRYSSCFDFR